MFQVSPEKKALNTDPKMRMVVIGHVTYLHGFILTVNLKMQWAKHVTLSNGSVWEVLFINHGHDKTIRS